MSSRSPFKRTPFIAKKDETLHIQLYPYCGICSDEIFCEPAVALYGNSDSTGYHGHTKPFSFVGTYWSRGPRWRTGRTANSCWHPDCHPCLGSATSPEAAPVHFDCLRLFQRHCSVRGRAAFERLWIVTSWRSPWHRARPPCLSAEPLDRDTLMTLSGFGGLPPLYKLPLELAEMIRHHSADSVFWRCLMALRVAKHVSRTKPGAFSTMPLRQVLSWERGGKLELVVRSSKPHQTLVITLDSAGVCKIERVSHRPPSWGGSRGRFAFIVEEEEFLPNVIVQLKAQKLTIWSTPSAPRSLYLRKPHCPPFADGQLMHAVKMDEVDGITFFFSAGNVVGIHPHLSSRPSCAMDTLRTLSEEMRGTVAWVYLPILRHDRVLLLGCGSRLGTRDVLIRTELVGDVVLGSNAKDEFRPPHPPKFLAAASADAPLTLIWAQQMVGRPVLFLGTYCQEQAETPPTSPFEMKNFGPCPIDIIFPIYMSSASLDLVMSTQIFYNEEGFCRGIIFIYVNGGAQAVGQCRVGVDSSKGFFEPTLISFCNTRDLDFDQDPVSNLQITFKQSDAETDAKDVTASEVWETRPMRGVVKFYSTRDCAFLAVEE
ncbi:hypothetical protein QBC37DRAFT_442797 [Rhypophila decipiens]|uniref:Uncharacterized protein n=1 Tax=Rhypophila decipiens TaxID=261697 RepID=A0AAN7B4U6_9PEZI|nr:hypothetical protein QBC37DRAFT_442797 [Rhypophila decipiens]